MSEDAGCSMAGTRPPRGLLGGGEQQDRGDGDEGDDGVHHVLHHRSTLLPSKLVSSSPSVPPTGPTV